MDLTTPALGWREWVPDQAQGGVWWQTVLQRRIFSFASEAEGGHTQHCIVVVSPSRSLRSNYPLLNIHSVHKIGFLFLHVYYLFLLATLSKLASNDLPIGTAYFTLFYSF